MGAKVTALRRMTPSDLDGVVALESANQPRPWSRRVFREELGQRDRIYLVAEDDGEVIGFGGVMLVGEEAHVTNLLVARERRGGGVGRALMRALVTEAIARGAKHLTLEVRRRNHPARSLYAALGMVPVGVRPKYYGDDDALVMWAHDIDRPGFLEGLG